MQDNKTTTSTTTEVRPLHVIAREIKADWPGAWRESHPAGAYLIPMSTLVSVKDSYGMDSAKSIVNYFLSNATTWRGENARRIKAELKAMVK